jgi:hypothetical protein
MKNQNQAQGPLHVLNPEDRWMKTLNQLIRIDGNREGDLAFSEDQCNTTYLLMYGETSPDPLTFNKIAELEPDYQEKGWKNIHFIPPATQVTDHTGKYEDKEVVPGSKYKIIFVHPKPQSEEDDQGSTHKSNYYNTTDERHIGAHQHHPISPEGTDTFNKDSKIPGSGRVQS